MLWAGSPLAASFTLHLGAPELRKTGTSSPAALTPKQPEGRGPVLRIATPLSGGPQLQQSPPAFFMLNL